MINHIQTFNVTAYDYFFDHIWTFECSYMIQKIIICRHIKSLYMIDHIWLSSMIIYLLIYEHIGSYMSRCLMFIYEHLTAYDSHIWTLPYMSSYMNTLTFVMSLSCFRISNQICKPGDRSLETRGCCAWKRSAEGCYIHVNEPLFRKPSLKYDCNLLKPQILGITWLLNR